MKTQPAAPPTKPLHTYRTEIPNLIDEMGLSPFEIALYVHVKRRAGDSGVCNENSRELAEATRMSAGQVSAAKRELVMRGLIEVRKVKGRDVISISDIWQKNLDSAGR
jgi:DNA-binding MarR family transcriptional regulator